MTKYETQALAIGHAFGAIYKNYKEPTMDNLFHVALAVALVPFAF